MEKNAQAEIGTLAAARLAVDEAQKVYNAARRALSKLLERRRRLVLAAPSDGEAW